MENYIQISKLNDFIFCPLSLYFHSLYQDFNVNLYHDESQKVGKIAHETIDYHSYSTRKYILQGTNVYSDLLGIAGKIDIYDIKNKELIERKAKVTKIYDGYIMQLYAQYYCLLEMGYKPQKLFIYSLANNKRYRINTPGRADKDMLIKLINDIRNFSIQRDYIKFDRNKNKCSKCIYAELCK